MQHNNNTYQIFTPSGCLTWEAMKAYHQKALNAEVKIKADNHLHECELCRDALEGYSLMNEPEKLSAVINEINSNLKNNLPKTENPGFIRRNYAYIAAATTIIILLGLVYSLNLLISNKTSYKHISQQIEIHEKRIPPKPGSQVGQNKISKKEYSVQPIYSESKASVEEADQIIQPSFDSSKLKGLEPNIKNMAEKIKPKKEKPKLFAKKQEQGIEKITSTDKPIDIASNQPIDYFLAEIVVSASVQNMNEEVSGMAFSRAANAKSARMESTGLVPLIVFKEKNTDGDMTKATPEEENDIHSQQTKEETDQVHFFKLVDSMPEFPGGQTQMKNYFTTQLAYPKEARDQNIQGRVILTFIVDKSGRTSDIQLLQRIGGGCDEEAARLIQSMPRWKPATKDGKPVNIRFTIPITFKLI
ncbi:MAG: energy transducer TonB [Bacteroidales bacterium]|nr:energy transducer TonB [Bacteroidales bacterium]